METITEAEWEAWCIKNQPENTGVVVFADHRLVWAILDGKKLEWELVA